MSKATSKAAIGRYVTRKARENVSLLLNEVVTLVTHNMEEAEVLNASFISVFTGKTDLQESHVPETRVKA